MRRYFQALLLLVAVFNLSGTGGTAEERTTPKDTTPPKEAAPQKDAAPRTEAEARVEFAKQDASRATAKEGTKERADLAKAVMQAASDVAWFAFDAGKFDEATTWFTRSAALKKESYNNARAYWENQLRTEVPKTEAGVEKTIKGWSDQLATATDDNQKKTLRAAIEAMSKMRLMVRYNTVSMLEREASENNDAPTLLKYYEQELDIRHTELDYLTKTAAPAPEIQAKQAEIARALEHIAAAQAEMAQFEAAEKNYLQALEIRRALPADLPQRDLDESLNALGFMYYHQIGDLGKARDYYQQALAALQESTALHRKEMETDSLAPEVRAQMSAADLAEHQARRAQIKDMALAGAAMTEGTIISNLGSVAHESGDYKTALAQHERALKLAESLPTGGYINIWDLARAMMRARALSDLADVHADSGEMDRALQELNEAIKIKRAIGQDESTANLLQQSAYLYYQKGDLKTARSYVEQVRQIFTAAQELRNVVSATSFLAILARESGQLDEAARYAEEALLLARKTGNISATAYTARTLASVRLRQNRLAEAATLLAEAEGVGARVGSTMDNISLLSLQGQLLEAQGRREAALEKYKQCVALLEGVRATVASESAFSDVKSNYREYERLVLLLIKMGRPDEAFDYLSRARSKQLQASLRLSSIKSGDKSLQALLDRAEGLKTKLRTVEAQLQIEQAIPEAERDDAKIHNLTLVAASTAGEWRRVTEQIKTRDPNYKKMMTVDPATLRETQRSIPPGVIFVEYVPLGEQLYIFLVTKDDLKIYTPPAKPEDVWKRIRAVRWQIVNPEKNPLGAGASSRGLAANRGAATGALVIRGARLATAMPETGAAPLSDNLTALYDMLIAPIEPELADKRTIALIPTGLFYYLPLHALARKQGDGLRFLVEDKQIVYLTAADVMRVVQHTDEDKQGGGLVAFGDPTGAGLPGAREEVNTIARIFPAADALSGAQVTKSAVSDPANVSKRIVHFATHGILNARVPDESYIQLAQDGKPDDAQLRVGEVWDLPLKKVDLVTLSACETALGEGDPDGGELTTIAEAFSSAGAKTVLASLWSVADDSTRDLMVEFYRQLAAGQGKAAALQAAEIKIMKDPKFAHPFYWAPFILMGDWR